jgi:hypothetical protein
LRLGLTRDGAGRGHCDRARTRFSPTGADVDLIVDVLGAVLPEHSSKVVT